MSDRFPAIPGRDCLSAKPDSDWIEQLLELKYLSEHETADITDIEFLTLKVSSPSTPVDRETAKHLIEKAHSGFGTRQIDKRLAVEAQTDSDTDTSTEPTAFTVIVAGLKDGDRPSSPYFIVRCDTVNTPEEFIERGLYTGDVPDDPETIKHEIEQGERFK